MIALLFRCPLFLLRNAIEPSHLHIPAPAIRRQKLEGPQQGVREVHLRVPTIMVKRCAMGLLHTDKLKRRIIAFKLFYIKRQINFLIAIVIEMMNVHF